MYLKTLKKFPLQLSGMPGNSGSLNCTGILSRYEADVAGYADEWRHCTAMPSLAMIGGHYARNRIDHTCSVSAKLIQNRDNQRVEVKSETDASETVLMCVFWLSCDC